jgi:hypothetical protein
VRASAFISNNGNAINSVGACQRRSEGSCQVAADGVARLIRFESTSNDIRTCDLNQKSNVYENRIVIVRVQIFASSVQLSELTNYQQATALISLGFVTHQKSLMDPHVTKLIMHVVQRFGLSETLCCSIKELTRKMDD